MPGVLFRARASTIRPVYYFAPVRLLGDNHPNYFRTPRFCIKQVDAHNVVPVWTTSDHKESMARTIRPKIHARPDLLGSIPELSRNPKDTKLPAVTDWRAARDSLDLDHSVPGRLMFFLLSVFGNFFGG